KNEFAKNNFLDASRRERISAETGLNINQVCYWFQYRRVKERKLQGRARVVNAFGSNNDNSVA
ncbi:hypothetical protein HELRODRAFT_92822, partial [Helobdella robusta]|uniref:Homeobox domain-containing protein n=1 Tax=Helobdella robusta TaxID=6412 RepID=T1G8L5_HELRO